MRPVPLMWWYHTQGNRDKAQTCAALVFSIFMSISLFSVGVQVFSVGTQVFSVGIQVFSIGTQDFAHVVPTVVCIGHTKHDAIMLGVW